jgi:hypothetical protein
MEEPLIRIEAVELKRKSKAGPLMIAGAPPKILIQKLIVPDDEIPLSPKGFKIGSEFIITIYPFPNFPQSAAKAVVQSLFLVGGLSESYTSALVVILGLLSSLLQ